MHQTTSKISYTLDEYTRNNNSQSMLEDSASIYKYKNEQM